MNGGGGFRVGGMDETPDAGVVRPMAGVERVVLLKPLVTSPLVEVGEFTYYDDSVDPEAFETTNVALRS